MNNITTLREIGDAICALWNFKLELPSRISIVLYYPIISTQKGFLDTTIFTGGIGYQRPPSLTPVN